MFDNGVHRHKFAKSAADQTVNSLRKYELFDHYDDYEIRIFDGYMIFVIISIRIAKIKSTSSRRQATKFKNQATNLKRQTGLFLRIKILKFSSTFVDCTSETFVRFDIETTTNSSESFFEFLS
uniref:Uncharacterized protein n=1 Tax=Romanomermis culicivorax TaxID=13658 RepID=A0A915IEC9_ROMCU